MARAKKSRLARKVRAVSDELGVTTPKAARRRPRQRVPVKSRKP